MRVPSLILAAVLAAPIFAHAGEDLTPEAFLPQHEKTHAHEPAAAFGGGVFLVVWRAGMNEDADLVGLRLDETGKPLDAKPFVISGAKDCQERPRLAFGAGHFLVVWHDLRSGKDWDVYAARVTPEGKVLDPDGLLVAGGENNQCEPAVCFDPSASSGQGGNFQLVWRQWNGRDYVIHGSRVTPAGKLLDGAQGVFLVNGKMCPKPSSPARMFGPGVGASANGMVVGSARLRSSIELWAMRDGKVVGKVVRATKNNHEDSAMFASDGKSLLAVWTTFLDGGGRSTGSSNAGMLLIRGPSGLTAKPKSLATSSLSFKTGKNRRHVRHPSPAWDGKSYVVAWDLECGGRRTKRYDAVFLRRIGADGKGLGNDQRIAGNFASPAFRPAVASDGKGTSLVAYERHPKTGNESIKIAFRMLRAK